MARRHYPLVKGIDFYLRRDMDKEGIKSYIYRLPCLHGHECEGVGWLRSAMDTSLGLLVGVAWMGCSGLVAILKNMLRAVP